jgi:hypothetical protein
MRVAARAVQSRVIQNLPLGVLFQHQLLLAESWLLGLYDRGSRLA